MNQSLKSEFKRINQGDSGGFQDGDYREEVESMLPKVNSWRDARDTPGKKNSKKEAKL
jgi:hypothetical protein